MSEKLGFTFYPKDWWTSDSYYDLTATERYLYLECLFTMYSNDGYLNYNKKQMERRFAMTITDEEFENVISRFDKDENGYTSITVNKRLKKAITSRENGKKGGAPKGNNNAQKQPKQPTKTTQNNPPSERERETELKENINEVEQPKFQQPTTGVEFEFMTLANCRIIYTTKYQLQWETICMNNKISKEQLKDVLDEFDKWVGTKETHKIPKDYCEHFARWITKEHAQDFIKKLKTPKNERSQYAHFGF